MKNYFLFFALVIFASCNTEHDFVENFSKVDDFKVYGDFHNEIVGAFAGRSELKSQLKLAKNEDEVVDCIYDYAKDSKFISGICPINKTELYTLLSDNKSLYNIAKIEGDNISAKLRVSRLSSLSDSELEEALEKDSIEINSKEDFDIILDYAVRHGIIDEKSHMYLSELFSIADNGLKSTVDGYELNSRLASLENRINSENFTSASNCMRTVAPPTAIAKASYQLWTDTIKAQIEDLYPDLEKEKVDSITQALVPPFIASDAGGAIIGAVSNAYSQWKKDGKITSWGSVGKSALIDGILASVGIETKLGNTLFNILKPGWKACEKVFWKIVFKLWK